MLSTNKVAKMLGITGASLSRYISSGKIPAPQTVTNGGMTIHLWTEEDIERVRQLLPKIANGRKTRYQKKQLAVGDEQLAKANAKSKTTKKPQPRAAVPHDQRHNKQ